MIHILVLGVVAAPLLCGLVLVLWARRLSLKLSYGLTLTATGGATLCALILLLQVDAPAVRHAGNLFTFAWLPDSGEIGLQLGATGLTMTLLTSGSLFLTQLVFPVSVAAKSTHLQIGKSINFLALSAANVAFLSSNFLGRYVALEVVGLCIALAPLLELRNGMRVTRFVYWALRVGDAGFLAAILLLMQMTGTLDIAVALKAGELLLPGQLAWLVAGLVLAVWVKVGVWPLHSWILSGQRLTSMSRTWLYGIVMPNLGLYLLYRITPLLIASGNLWSWVFWLSVVAIGMALFLLLLWRQSLDRLPIVGGAFLGGLALCFASLGMQAQVWWLAMAFAPLRMIWGAVGEKLSTELDTYTTNRTGFLPVASVVSSGYLSRFAQQIHHFVEVGVFERLVTDIPRAIFNAARWLNRVIERGTLEGALRAVVRAVLAMGHGLQRWHTGRLRANLGWVVVALVLVALVIVN